MYRFLTNSVHGNVASEAASINNNNKAERSASVGDVSVLFTARPAVGHASLVEVTAVQVAGKTDVGCVRSKNEDSFAYSTQLGVFIVCDGVGGQAAGELASQIGVRTVLNYFREGAEHGDYPRYGRIFAGVSWRANALGSAIQLANRSILDAAGEDPTLTGMSSTIVAGLVQESGVSIAHVGDSRIYLIRGASIRQLTVDHSLLMEQVRRGMISMEEAAGTGVQNYIIRALGAETEVEPDLADLNVEPGDVLLFTSDGLTRHVSDSQIARLVRQSTSLDAACEALIHAAKKDGGSDNITCVLVRLAERSECETQIQCFSQTSTSILKPDE